MPFRFKRYDEEPWKSRGLHIMPVDKTVQIDKDQQEVLNLITFKKAMIKQ